MPYHSKGIGKNKKIREQRKKPLPLMEHYFDKTKGMWIHRRRISEDNDTNKDVPGAECLD